MLMKYAKDIEATVDLPASDVSSTSMFGMSVLLDIEDRAS